MCLICLVAMIFVSLMRGSRNFDSIVGIQRCSFGDWSILILYLVICGAVCTFAVKNVLKEQDLKMRVGFGIRPGDVQF